MKRKILFANRDGTLIYEPPETEQIDTLEEMTILPHVISSLKRFAEAGYEIISYSNQDNVGTPKNPRENYDKINNKLQEIFKSEGVTFFAILTCGHAPDSGCGCRTPKTGMIDSMLKSGEVDLKRSVVIGDRETDVQFAENAGMRGYRLGKLTWPQITHLVLDAPRMVNIHRKTAETDISLHLNLDGSGKYAVNSGLKFFDHMLEQFAKHGQFDVELACKGDMEIDEHHTIEDIGLVLGEAFKTALGERRGIERYAWERVLPMDDAKAEIAMDFSGRPLCVFKTDPMREYVGDFPSEMLPHFLRSFCEKAGINLHLTLTGHNTHHLVEAAFKALARCMRDAVKKSGNSIPSTKGML